MISIQEQINIDIKEAMKDRNVDKLAALRAVKSAFLLAKTEAGAGDDITPEQEMKIIQKQKTLVKKY